MINFNRFVIDYNNMNERIDKFVALRFPDVSRTHIQKLIAEEYILVNNGTVKSNYKLNLGDEITVQIPKAIEPEIQAEEIPLDVLYEDDDINDGETLNGDYDFYRRIIRLS